MEDFRRKSGLDIVRCIAILFVISVHFYSYSNLYDVPIEGRRMFLLVCGRWLFYTCVPLFLLLSGFLLNRKTVSKGYYKGMIRILFVYVVMSVLCNLFKIFHDGAILTWKDWILSILGYEAAHYTWYVQMYIGLFLLVPFINMIYHGLQGKKQKIWLIVSMLLITSAPGLLNFKFQILPNWWLTLYPITYYFIGAYISEYRPTVNKVVCMVLIALTVSMETVLSKVQGNVLSFASAIEGYGSLLTVVAAVLVFLLFYQIDIRNTLLKKVLKCVSNASFAMYLASWLLDSLVYNKVNVLFPDPQDKIFGYFAAVPIIFLGSFVIGEAVQLAYDLLIGGFLHPKRKEDQIESGRGK